VGDTENGSWGSSELGGYIRREEARKEWEKNAAERAVRDRDSQPSVLPPVEKETDRADG